MVGFSRVRRVSRVSRIKIMVSVRIRVRFSFTGANPYIAMAALKLRAAPPGESR